MKRKARNAKGRGKTSHPFNKSTVTRDLPQGLSFLGFDSCHTVTPSSIIICLLIVARSQHRRRGGQLRKPGQLVTIEPFKRLFLTILDKRLIDRIR
jgi:hypothetical protein